MSTEIKQQLIDPFLEELQKEWPSELSEIRPKDVQQAISQTLITSIRMAFLGGYMMGKGWLSINQLSDVNLRLGDNLASEVRRTIKKAKSRGVAFASAFASVGVNGHLAAIRH